MAQVHHLDAAPLPQPPQLSGALMVLPYHLLRAAVLKRCNILSLVRFSRTCKHLKQVINSDETLWRELFDEYYPGHSLYSMILNFPHFQSNRRRFMALYVIDTAYTKLYSLTFADVPQDFSPEKMRGMQWIAGDIIRYYKDSNEVIYRKPDGRVIYFFRDWIVSTAEEQLYDETNLEGVSVDDIVEQLVQQQNIKGTVCSSLARLGLYRRSHFLSFLASLEPTMMSVLAKPSGMSLVETALAKLYYKEVHLMLWDADAGRLIKEERVPVRFMFKPSWEEWIWNTYVHFTRPFNMHRGKHRITICYHQSNEVIADDLRSLDQRRPVVYSLSLIPKPPRPSQSKPHARWRR